MLIILQVYYIHDMKKICFSKCSCLNLVSWSRNDTKWICLYLVVFKVSCTSLWTSCWPCQSSGSYLQASNHGDLGLIPGQLSVICSRQLAAPQDSVPQNSSRLLLGYTVLAISEDNTAFWLNRNITLCPYQDPANFITHTKLYYHGNCCRSQHSA